MAQTPWGLTISHSLQINKSHSRHWSFYNLNTPVNLLKWWAIEENNRKAAIKWELKHKYRQTGGKFEKEAGDSKVMVQGLFCFPIFYFLFCKCCIEMEFKGTKWDANLCLRCYNQSELCLYEGFTANQNNGNDLVSVGTLSPSKNGKKITWIVSESDPKVTWSSLLGGDLKHGRSASQPSVGPPNLFHQELGRRCSGAPCGNSATASDDERRIWIWCQGWF